MFMFCRVKLSMSAPACFAPAATWSARMLLFPFFRGLPFRIRMCFSFKRAPSSAKSCCPTEYRMPVVSGIRYSVGQQDFAEEGALLNEKHILILKGSPRKKGNSSILADQVAAGAKQAGADIESFTLQNMNIHP